MRLTDEAAPTEPLMVFLVEHIRCVYEKQRHRDRNIDFLVEYISNTWNKSVEKVEGRR